MPKFRRPGVRGTGRAAIAAARSASTLATADAALALAAAKGLAKGLAGGLSSAGGATSSSSSSASLNGWGGPAPGLGRGSQHLAGPSVVVADLWVLGGCLEASSPSDASSSPSRAATVTRNFFAGGRSELPSSAPSKDMRRATVSLG